MLAVLKGHATAIGVEAGDGTMLNQLVTGLAGRANPVHHHLVAAYGSGGGFEQAGEVRLGLQREARSDLRGIEGFVGDALVIHDATGSGD